MNIYTMNIIKDFYMAQNNLFTHESQTQFKYY